MLTTKRLILCIIIILFRILNYSMNKFLKCTYLKVTANISSGGIDNLKCVRKNYTFSFINFHRLCRVHAENTSEKLKKINSVLLGVPTSRVVLTYVCMTLFDASICNIVHHLRPKRNVLSKPFRPGRSNDSLCITQARGIYDVYDDNRVDIGKIHRRGIYIAVPQQSSVSPIESRELSLTSLRRLPPELLPVPPPALPLGLPPRAAADVTSRSSCAAEPRATSHDPQRRSHGYELHYAGTATVTGTTISDADSVDRRAP
ncbi:hypothetical protein QTP88_001425 [Uroleucon formosanum]